jgi:hypothetical protein
MSLTIDIDLSQTRVLSDWAGPVTAPEARAISAELARLVQRHLRARDNSNAHEYPDGGRRSHFWRKAAESVTFSGDADNMSVTVTHQGVRLRYAGAPDGIKPVNAKALAIPATGIAYGRLPREFNDLHVVVFKGKGKAALVQRREGEALGTVMYWLIKKTKPIKGDPTVLPPANVVLGLAVMRLRAIRDRKAQTNG